MSNFDPVNRPQHYADRKHEPIDVIEDWGLGYHLGCVLKYIARDGLKANDADGLRKASWYLQREIARREAQQ